MNQQMKTITTAYGEKIQSKVFAVGQRVIHNSPAVVVESDAVGYPEGHVTLKSDAHGTVYVAWANHCMSAEQEIDDLLDQLERALRQPQILMPAETQREGYYHSKQDIA